MAEAALALLAFAFALVGAVLQVRRIMLGRASLQWPVAQGTVLDARFDESASYDEDAWETTSWSAHLEYRYTVKGRPYRSRHFTWRPTSGLGQSEAYALLQGLRRGSDVDVHSDPKRPDRAVVIPGIAAGNWLNLLVWVLGAALALVWAYSS